ncbi:MAG: MFS transporter [Nostocoides sp.]
MGIPRAIERLLPENRLARSLALRSVLYAMGSGAFLTGSAFYFTHFVGLSAAKVGLGLTIGGIASFLTAVPLGRLSDRFGPRRVWFICSVLGGLTFLAWPFAHGFGAFVAIMVAGEVIDAAGSSARGAYTLDAFAREERVRSMAFMRSALNIGFTLGALIGGLALAMPTDTGMRALPYATAVVLVLGALLILRLPDPTHQHVAEPGAPATGTALRNRGYLATSIISGVLTTNQVLLNVVIPLWLVQETDAPRVLLAWLFGTNTVLAVLLQVPASRGSDTIPGALRASRLSAGFFTLSCFIVLFTHSTIGWVTIVLVWIGHVTVTGAELFESASQWGFQAELSDPGRRGEYQGVSKVGFAIGGLWAPAAYTWLAMNLHALGWVIIAAIVLTATLAIGPSVRAAERYLAVTVTRERGVTRTG